MRALRIHAFGGFDQIQLEEIAELRPGPGEVAVRVRAAGLNPSDAKNVQGKMEGTTLPRTLGRDFAGVIVGGRSDLLGQAVWGSGGDIGFTRDGAQAETILVPEAGVRLMPAKLSFEQAATVGVAFLTAWIGLERAQVQAGETVLVTGAAGQAGGAAIQIAKWKGARTIGVDQHPLTEERQAAAGMDHYLMARDEASAATMVQAAQRLTHPRGVQVAFDTVGGPLFEPCLRTLGQLGRQVNITSVGERRVSFDLLDFYHRQLSLFGVDSRAYDTVGCAEVLEKLAPGFQSGALKPPVIAAQYRLEQAAEAYAAVNGGLRGKAVFVVA